MSTANYKGYTIYTKDKYKSFHILGISTIFKSCVDAMEYIDTIIQ